MLGILAVSATILIAQTEATNSPNAQSTTSVQNIPATPSLSEQDMQVAMDKLEKLSKEYSLKGDLYRVAYVIFAIGAALTSALAGLLLQWDTPEKNYKKRASILAFVSAALVTVMTYWDFSANTHANKGAMDQIEYLKIQVKDGEFKKLTEVEKRYWRLGYKGEI